MLYALSRHIKNERVRKLYSKTVYSLLNYVLFPIIHFFSDWKSNGQLRHALGGLFLKPRMLKEIFPLTSMLPSILNSSSIFSIILERITVVIPFSSVVLLTT